MQTADRVKYFVENEMISQVKDDPRDELIIRSQELQKKLKKTSKELAKAKKAYWNSLATPKRKQPPPTPIEDEFTVSEINTSRRRKCWSVKRLNELSKPRTDYYEYAEEIVTIRRCTVRRVDFQRINYLAQPRRNQSEIDCRNYKCNYKVPLSTLLPRLEQLSAPKRNDNTEIIREDEDAFSVKKSALEYVATERLKRLATPRPSYQDFK